MKLVPTAVTRKVGRQILVAKKNSPKIFFVGGIVGVGVGTYLACKSTLKLHETLDEIHEEVDNVKAKVPVTETDEKAQQKELTHAYVRGGVKVARLYLPAAVVMGTSVAALTGSHVILTRRNAAVTAAYAAFAERFDHYRERVRAEIGEEKEVELYHAAEWQDVPGSDGKIQELVADPGKWSPYSRFFDRTNPNWQKDPALNRFFIDAQQRYANHLLNARGHVFLNEVYNNLGIPHSSEGQAVGWVLDGEGDGYIDFGVYEAVNADFVTGQDKDILLDFNVDGVVWDKI